MQWACGATEQEGGEVTRKNVADEDHGFFFIPKSANFILVGNG